MQRGESGLAQQVEALRRPSLCLDQQSQVARLPVRLLSNEPAAAEDDRAEGGFQLKVDAQGFSPEELEVRVDGGCLVVTGQQHLESCGPNGGGFRMARKVHKQMQLPPDLDPASMTCCLTPSGQLYVRSHCRLLPSPGTGLSRSSQSYNLA
ncbi:heat shock protein beta-9 [Tenrec ecaudatus]|uniref:heat shock protein beta-9 n=1 Tax=Tenrec ecaudatus TaxID=94439 RepID=UPI003F59C2F0